MKLDDSRIVRAIFCGRELLSGAELAAPQMPQRLVARMKALGWGVLA